MSKTTLSDQEALKEMQEELKWIKIKEDKEGTFSQKAKNKFASNPLVPIGCSVTAVVLGRGLYYLYKRDSMKQQRYMRYRVLAQGVTVIIAALSMFGITKN